MTDLREAGQIKFNFYITLTVFLQWAGIIFPDYFVIAKQPLIIGLPFRNGSDKERLYGKNHWH
jgi:hypothetical protein